MPVKVLPTDEQKQQIVKILKEKNKLILPKRIEELRRLLEAITDLNLDGQNFTSDAMDSLSQALKANRSLKTLSLKKNKIGNTGIKLLAEALQGNNTLSKILLYNNKITNEGIMALAPLLPNIYGLKELDLNWNRIGDDGLVGLADILSRNVCSLTTLGIGYNKFGIVGIKALANSLEKSNSLTEIFLGKIEIGDVGIEAIAQGLKTNRSLILIDLTSTKISTNGARTLIPILMENYTLIDVILQDNPIDDSVIKEINRLLDRNAELSNDLFVAVKNGDMQKVKELLASGISSTTRDEKDNTILHLAVLTGNTEMLIYLANLRRDFLAIENADGKTPMDIAIERNDQACIQLLQGGAFKPTSSSKILSSHSSQGSLTGSGKTRTSPQSSSWLASKRSSSESSSLGKGQISELSLTCPLIPYSELTLGKCLGEGGFGAVYKGTWQLIDVAIKQLKMQNMAVDTLVEFKSESSIMANLRHLNVINFYGISIDTPGKYSMVMELMPNGSLYDVLHNQKPLDWELRHQIVKDIIAGLIHLHSKNILHRDLKSPNVLMDGNMRAKLTDFGLSKVKTETSSTTSDVKVGTIPWMAPELFERKGKYTEKADIYSLGMVVWEIVTRMLPFAQTRSGELIIMWVQKGDREDIPENCPDLFKTLIKWCWKQNPDERPIINEAAKMISSAQLPGQEKPPRTKPAKDSSSFLATTHRHRFFSDGEDKNKAEEPNYNLTESGDGPNYCYQTGVS